jgi:hypothetical protein
MKLRTTLIATTFAATSFVSGIAQAALHVRDSFLIYDDVLDITWQKDANGFIFWQTAITAAADDSYGGYHDWRLPTINELSSLYYVGLGNSGCSANSYSPEGCGWVDDPANPSDENLFGPNYLHKIWSSTELDTDYAYNFDMTRGISESAYKQGGDSLMVLVRSGDVAAVPETQTFALMLSGLALVGAAARRRRG